MSWFNELQSAIGPILPGLVVAAIFIVLLLGLRFKFRGEALGARFKRPVAIFYLYLFLFALVVLARLYAPSFYRVLLLVSLMVLTLAVILAISVGLFDLFLGRLRQLNVPVILRDLVILIVYVVVVVVVIGQEGVDVTSIVTTSAVLTAVIGFALQDLLSNIISGLAIEIEHPFRVGDWVKFENQEGIVREINWRSTKIETLHRDIVIIPNNVATRTPIINFCAPTNLHRRKVTVGMRYDAAPNRVKASLLKAVQGVEGLLRDPEPFVQLKEYGDFSISYTLFFFIDDFAIRDRVEDRVRTRIWYQLGRDGLSIPFPIRDVNVRTLDAAEEARRHERVQSERVGLLGQVPFLEPLAEQDLVTLALRLRSEFYAAGETILRQGDPGDSFYIVASGGVEVFVGKAPAVRRRVATLGAQEFFGEMSLMTGAERSADIVATRDTECYVLDKTAFKSIITGNDALVEAIGRRLAARQAELLAAREQSDGKAAPIGAEVQRTLVSRIRSFFQL